MHSQDTIRPNNELNAQTSGALGNPLNGYFHVVGGIDRNDGTGQAGVPLGVDASGNLTVTTTFAGLNGQPAPAYSAEIGYINGSGNETAVSPSTPLPVTLQLQTNYGTVDNLTLRTASEVGNATGSADFNSGSVGAQTLRTVLENQTRNVLGSTSDAANASTIFGQLEQTVLNQTNKNQATQITDGTNVVGTTLINSVRRLNVTLAAANQVGVAAGQYGDEIGGIDQSGNFRAQAFSNTNPTGTEYAQVVRTIPQLTTDTQVAGTTLNLNDAVTLNTQGLYNVSFQILGAASGATHVFEFSDEAVAANWNALYVTNENSSIDPINSTTTNGNFITAVGSYQWVRVRRSVAGTGTANIILNGSIGQQTVEIQNLPTRAVGSPTLTAVTVQGAPGGSPLTTSTVTGGIIAPQTTFNIASAGSGSANSVTAQVTPGMKVSFCVQIPVMVAGGTFTTVFEGSTDNINYNAINVIPKTVPSGQTPVNNTSAIGLFTYAVGSSINYVRARLSALSSIPSINMFIDDFTTPGSDINLPYVAGLTANITTGTLTVPTLEMGNLSEVIFDIQSFTGTSQLLTYQQTNDPSLTNLQACIVSNGAIVTDGTASTSNAGGIFRTEPLSRYFNVKITHTAITAMTVNGIKATLTGSTYPISQAVTQGTAANLNAQVVGATAQGSAQTGNPVMVAGKDFSNLLRMPLFDQQGFVATKGSGEIIVNVPFTGTGAAAVTDGTNGKVISLPLCDCDIDIEVTAVGTTPTAQAELSWQQNADYAIIPLSRQDIIAASQQYAYAAAWTPVVGMKLRGRSYRAPFLRMHLTAGTGTTTLNVRIIPRQEVPGVQVVPFAFQST
jgi:hypothetical protein